MAMQAGRVAGCGIDIEELSRFRHLIPGPGGIPGFSRMVFTEKEIENHLGIHPEITFPLSFSCKEAFFKAFGISWSNSPLSWKDIGLIFHDENNLQDYHIELNGYALEWFNQRISRIETSFENKDEYILFRVLFISN